MQTRNLRADAGGKGIPIYALRSDADFNAVMRVPSLVLKHDWPAFARETGVYTNEKHLRNLVKRCFEKSLTEAAFKERGLQQLMARLRVTDGGSAPRALLPLEWQRRRRRIWGCGGRSRHRRGRQQMAQVK